MFKNRWTDFAQSVKVQDRFVKNNATAKTSTLFASFLKSRISKLERSFALSNLAKAKFELKKAQNTHRRQVM